MATAAAVWVDVLPSLRGFGSSLTKQVTTAATTAGTQGGKQLATSTHRQFERGMAGTGTRIGKSVSTELSKSLAARSRGAMTGLSRAFDRTFSWAEGLATHSGGRIARGFGRSLTGVLGPLGRFRDGFAHASAAASRFSGIAGTMGGRVRAAVDGAVASVSAFRSGFAGAATAATGFARVAAGVGRSVGAVWDTARAPLAGFRRGFADASGAAGTFAATATGVANRVGQAFQGAGAFAGRFRDGFRSSAAAASAFSGVAGTVGGTVRRAFDTAAAPIAGFRRGFSDATGAATMFSATTTGIAGRIGNVFQRAGGVVGRFRDGFQNAGAAASAFGGAASTAGGVVRRAFDGVHGAVTRVGTNIRTAAQQGAHSLQGMVAPLGRMLKFTGLAAVGTAVAGIGFAGARSAIQIDQSQAALSGLYGSGRMANDMLARMRKLAATSPIEYTAFLRGAESLAYMGYSGDVTETVLKRVNSALVASGRGAEAMDQVNYAMLEMVNTGKVYAQQLTQMSQAGLPVWSMLADYMGASIAEVREQVTAGAVEIDTVMQAIQAGGGETFQRMEAASNKASQTLQSVWRRTKDNVALAFADMIRPMTGGAAGALAAAGGAITSAFQALPGVLHSVGTFLAPVWQGFRMIAGAAGGALLFGLRAVGTVLSTVFGPALRAVTGLLREHQIVLTIVGGALGAIAIAFAVTQGAMLAYQGVMLAVRIATAAWAATQWVLNAALLANPIGLVVVALAGLAAAVVYAWQNFAWFRNIVTGAWRGIVAAATWAWDTVLAPILHAFAAVVRGVGGAFSWLWHGAVVPAWNGIAAAAGWAWNTVLSPIFSVMGWYLRMVGQTYSWLWHAAVVPAWNGITAVVGWAWNAILRPIFDAIGFGLRLLGTIVFTVLATPFVLAWNLVSSTVRGAYHGVIKPTWDAMAAAIGWLWNSVLRPVFGWIGAAWHGLLIGMQAVWNTVLRPVWQTVAAVAQWLWNTVLRVVFAAIGAQWHALLIGMQAVWNMVLRPAWNAVAAAARWLWNTVLSPVFAAIGFGWRMLVVGMQTVWNTMLRPTWDAISAAARFLWNGVLRPVFTAIGAGWNALMRGIQLVWQTVLRPTFDAIKAAVHSVGQAFSAAVDWIGRVWNRIRGILAKPVNFVIDFVYNKGIVGTWNKIAGWLGIGGLQPMGRIPENKRGGIIPGYLPGRDTQLSWVSPGEAVMRPEWARAMGPDYVNQANQVARARGVSGVRSLMGGSDDTGTPTRSRGEQAPQFAPYGDAMLPAFAGGGHTWPAMWKIVQGMFPGAIKTSDYRPGDSGFHGRGQALDFVTGNMNRDSRKLVDRYPDSTEIIHTPTAMIKRGRQHSYSAAVRANHYDHIHWANQAAPGEGGGGGGLGFLNPLKAVVAWFKHAMKPVTDRGGELTDKFGDALPMAGMAKIPGKAVGEGVSWLGRLGSSAISKIFSSVSGWIMEKFGALFGGGISGGGAAPPGQVNDWIMQALSILRWPPNYAAGLYQQIQTESGGNPGAVQHGYVDINTITGNLARGIMQVIPPTFRANALPGHGNIMNPVDNIIAGARYAMRRYGASWFRTGGHHNSGYDDGGWLMPGETLAANRTGRPEPVLTEKQWDTVSRMVDSYGNTRSITVNAKTDADPAHIAHAIDRRMAMRARL